MQRRWAAVCIAFFLVMGATAFSVMALAEEPTVDIEGDTYGDGDTFQQGGTTYTVTASEGSGEITFDETVEEEQAFENNTEVEFRNGTYSVRIGAGNNADSFTLVQEFDVEALLSEDPEVENSTFTRDDGTEVVVYRNGTTQPLEEYVDRDRATFGEGDSIEHDDRTKTVANVTSERALLTWTTEQEQSVGLAEGETFTLDDTEYVAHFPENDTVVISTDVDAYETHEQKVDNFEERLSGLLYVIVFSVGSSFLIGALAFLPHRG